MTRNSWIIVLFACSTCDAKRKVPLDNTLALKTYCHHVCLLLSLAQYLYRMKSNNVNIDRKGAIFSIFFVLSAPWQLNIKGDTCLNRSEMVSLVFFLGLFLRCRLLQIDMSHFVYCEMLIENSSSNSKGDQAGYQGGAWLDRFTCANQPIKK